MGHVKNPGLLQRGVHVRAVICFVLFFTHICFQASGQAVVTGKLHTTAVCLVLGTWYVLFFLFIPTHTYLPASGQAVVTGVVPSPPRFLPFNFYRA